MKKYLEVYQGIKNKIVSGEYKTGEKLPSKRITADKTGTSVITVEKAYNMLCELCFCCRPSFFRKKGGN